MGFSEDESMLEVSAFGIVGGLVSAVTAHPLDTVKTRIQTGAAIDVMLRHPSMLCRGILAPVLAIPPAWTANFVAYGALLKLTGDKTTFQHTGAGALSGIVYGTAVSPFELVKAIAQNEGKTTSTVWSEMYSTRGLLGFARALELSLLQYTLGAGIWFGTYHHVLQTLGQSSFVAGGAAGIGCWFSILPLDTWRIIHQTTKGSVRQSFDATRAHFATNSSMVFRLLPVLGVRQFLSIGASMTAVEYMRGLLSKSR